LEYDLAQEADSTLWQDIPNIHGKDVADHDRAKYAVIEVERRSKEELQASSEGGRVPSGDFAYC
jgi:hypothetical protein